MKCPDDADFEVTEKAPEKPASSLPRIRECVVPLWKGMTADCWQSGLTVGISIKDIREQEVWARSWSLRRVLRGGR